MNAVAETIDNTMDTMDLMDAETGTVVDVDTLTESIPTPKTAKVKKEKVVPVYDTMDLTNLAKGLTMLNGTPGDVTFYRGEVRFKTNLDTLVKTNDRLVHDLFNIGWVMNTDKGFIGLKIK